MSNYSFFIGACGVMAAMNFSSVAKADDKPNAVTEAAHDTANGVKKAGRSVKDSTCTLVKGKMECAADKMKHKAQNVGDDLKK